MNQKKKQLTKELNMKKEKIYLRQKVYNERYGQKTTLDIFIGDIKKDKIYWKDFDNIDAKYFELKEIKIK